jgi:TM2 domain-containing membrane protein YozV
MNQKNKFVFLILFVILISQISYSQYLFKKENSNINKITFTKDTIPDIKISEHKKNPAISLLLSLAVPGIGHIYTGRGDVGKYFLTTEALCWIGVLGLNFYSDALKNDARTYAGFHSGLDKNGKDDNYFVNVGNFNSVYEYNDDKLRRGDYDQLYDINTYFWSWDSQNNRLEYDNQRKKGERFYNGRIIFFTGMIVNRIVSAISALILTNDFNKSVTSSININTEFVKGPNNNLLGFKVNLIKSF